MLYDFLVVRQIVSSNPAHAVRGRGLATQQRLQTVSPKTRVIIITANDDAWERPQAEQARPYLGLFLQLFNFLQDFQAILYHKL